ncbi:hypothetical protein GmHk_10G028218 [Glycine max]|nr:hypothetical protein GmHk_10G028218 [Glycine max]
MASTDEMKRKKSKCEYGRQLQMMEQKLEHLTNRVNKLESAKKLLESMKAVVEACDEIEASYNILRAKYMEFTNELHVLKMVDEKLSDEILDLN